MNLAARLSTSNVNLFSVLKNIDLSTPNKTYIFSMSFVKLVVLGYDLVLIFSNIYSASV
jgi:hypothetical protein